MFFIDALGASLGCPASWWPTRGAALSVRLEAHLCFPPLFEVKLSSAVFPLFVTKSSEEDAVRKASSDCQVFRRCVSIIRLEVHRIGEFQKAASRLHRIGECSRGLVW